MDRTVESEQPGSILRTEREVAALPVVVLTPQAPPRVVGPGRKERSYQQRIAALEGAVAGKRSLEHEIEVARLVERGSGRMLDRLEGSLEARDEALERAREQMNRLLVTMGGLQRDNEHLHAELTAKSNVLATLQAPRSRWRALFERRRVRS
jgi:hypothetical protein